MNFIQMGVTKHIGFKEDINSIAEVFKALGHPARLQIMNILLDKELCSCGNIVDILPLAQSTVSNHLLELKKANLVNISSVGKSSFYSIQKDKLDFLHQFISNYIDSLNVNTHRTTDENKTIFEKDINTTSNKSVAKNSKSGSNLKQYNYKFKHKK